MGSTKTYPQASQSESKFQGSKWAPHPKPKLIWESAFYSKLQVKRNPMLNFTSKI